MFRIFKENLFICGLTSTSRCCHVSELSHPSGFSSRVISLRKLSLMTITHSVSSTSLFVPIGTVALPSWHTERVFGQVWLYIPWRQGWRAVGLNGFVSHAPFTVPGTDETECSFFNCFLLVCDGVPKVSLIHSHGIIVVSHLAPAALLFISQLCPTLCDPMDCSTPGLPGLHHLLGLLKLTSIESVIPSNHLILCRPLLLWPSISLSIRVFPMFLLDSFFWNQSIYGILYPCYEENASWCWRYIWCIINLSDTLVRICCGWDLLSR